MNIIIWNWKVQFVPPHRDSLGWLLGVLARRGGGSIQRPLGACDNQQVDLVYGDCVRFANRCLDGNHINVSAQECDLLEKIHCRSQ